MPQTLVEEVGLVLPYVPEVLKDFQAQGLLDLLTVHGSSLSVLVPFFKNNNYYAMAPGAFSLALHPVLHSTDLVGMLLQLPRMQMPL